MNEITANISLSINPHITTFTGRKVNPLHLRVEDVCIEDIAHALACTNRFCGHTKEPISIAQHSVFVAKLCRGEKFELQALLHDASEAYLGDITKWLKQTPEFQGYRDAEAHAQAVIFSVFDCALELAPEVEAADRLMVRYEADWSGIEILHPEYPAPTILEKLMIGQWEPWPWQTAETVFLSEFEGLYHAPEVTLREA